MGGPLRNLIRGIRNRNSSCSSSTTQCYSAPPVQQSYHTHQPVAGPTHGGAAFPSSQATQPVQVNRAAENAHVNTIAQEQFEQVKDLGMSPEQPGHEEFTAHDACGRQISKRYLRMSEDNKLEEWRPVGTKPDGQPEYGWKPAQNMKQYYYAAGKLYDASGTLLGDLGIATNTRNLAGSRFLHGSATYCDASGKAYYYDGRSLTFNGEPAVIKMGPPPGTVQTFQPSTRKILVDGGVDRCGNKYFTPIHNDHASEVVYKKGGAAPETTAYPPSLKAVFDGTRRDVELTGADGKTQSFTLSRMEGNTAYFAGADGLEQFRITKGINDATGAETYNLERKIHFATAWEESIRVQMFNRCGGVFYRCGSKLSSAKVGWMKDQGFALQVASPSDVPDTRNSPPTPTPVTPAPVTPTPQTPPVPGEAPTPLLGGERPVAPATELAAPPLLEADRTLAPQPGGPTPPLTSGDRVVAPHSGGATPRLNAGDRVVAPTTGGSTPMLGAGDRVIAPSSGGSAPPLGASDRVLAPTSGGATPPLDARPVAPPSGSGTPPLESRPVAPASGTGSTPLDSRPVAPPSGATTPPLNSRPTSPSVGGTTSDLSGRTTAPASGASAAPIDTRTTAPTAGESAPPLTAEDRPLAPRPASAPTLGGRSTAPAAGTSSGPVDSRGTAPLEASAPPVESGTPAPTAAGASTPLNGRPTSPTTGATTPALGDRPTVPAAGASSPPVESRGTAPSGASTPPIESGTPAPSAGPSAPALDSSNPAPAAATTTPPVETRPAAPAGRTAPPLIERPTAPTESTTPPAGTTPSSPAPAPTPRRTEPPLPGLPETRPQVAADTETEPRPAGTRPLVFPDVNPRLNGSIEGLLRDTTRDGAALSPRGRRGNLNRGTVDASLAGYERQLAQALESKNTAEQLRLQALIGRLRAESSDSSENA